MGYEEANAAIRSSLAQRELRKATQVLTGICAGIASDSRINEQEIHYLQTWLAEYPEVAAAWPGYMLADRIRTALADGVITAEEQTDILETLRQLSSNRFAETGAAQAESPLLPLDDDPSIFFRNMTFCFTGNFIFGTRAACERIVLSLGSMPVDRVSRKLDYLVIGTLIEPAWANSTYGRKIETAVRYRDKGVELCIVSEHQWTAALKDATRSPDASQ